MRLPQSGRVASIDATGDRYSLLAPEAAEAAAELGQEAWSDIAGLQPLNGFAGGHPDVLVAYGASASSHLVTIESCGGGSETTPADAEWIEHEVFRLGDLWVAEIPRAHRWYRFRCGESTTVGYRRDRTRRPTPPDGPGWFAAG